MYSGAVYPGVPTTLVDTWVLYPAGPSLASPKSDSLAVESWEEVRRGVRGSSTRGGWGARGLGGLGGLTWSNKMLPAFRSRMMGGRSVPSWR